MYWNGISANARLNELETKSSYLTRYNDKREHGVVGQSVRKLIYMKRVACYDRRGTRFVFR